MIPPANETVHLPSVIKEAIGATADLVGDKPVAIIAETPAHLPAVESRHEPLVKIIKSMIAHVVRSTNHAHVKIQVGLLSTAETSQIFTTELEGAVWDSPDRSMWAMVTISDVDGHIKLPLSVDHMEVSGIPESEVAEGDDELSLKSCRSTIEGIGGHLRIEEESGVGIRLYLLLPLKAAHASSADVSSLRRAVETRLEGDLSITRTILLMAEDADMREILIKDFTEAGYRMITTQNGGNVLPLAREENPDLILLDLLARDPLALDIAMVLKRDYRTQGIPVLFLTFINDPQEGMKMGTVDFLVRRVGTGALLSMVNTVLRSGLNPASRVLVVEPDEATRERIVLMIQAQGYRVTVATGPEEAQVLAERVDPGLILVNGKLAQERDYWLLRGLRQISEGSDIFVVADALSDAEVRAIISRGASGYSDPGELPDLLNRVRKQRGGG